MSHHVSSQITAKLICDACGKFVFSVAADTREELVALVDADFYQGKSKYFRISTGRHQCRKCVIERIQRQMDDIRAAFEAPAFTTWEKKA